LADQVGGILDTSIFIAREQRRTTRPTPLPDGLAVSVVTLAELRVGVLRETDARRQVLRLATLERALRIRTIDIDETVAFNWAVLRARAQSHSQDRVNDLWIAATALALRVPVITQDEGFVRLKSIGGPDVIVV